MRGKRLPKHNNANRDEEKHGRLLFEVGSLSSGQPLTSCEPTEPRSGSARGEAAKPRLSLCSRREKGCALQLRLDVQETVRGGWGVGACSRLQRSGVFGKVLFGPRRPAVFPSSTLLPLLFLIFSLSDLIQFRRVSECLLGYRKTREHHLTAVLFIQRKNDSVKCLMSLSSVGPFKTSYRLIRLVVPQTNSILIN